MDLGRAESGNQRACGQSEAAEQGVAAKTKNGKRRRELRRWRLATTEEVGGEVLD
jgi:hypothetical protein